MTVVQSLLASRKAWVLLLSIVSVTILTLVGKLTADQALNFVKWVISAWLGAVALEDAADKVQLPPSNPNSRPPAGGSFP